MLAPSEVDYIAPSEVHNVDPLEVLEIKWVKNRVVPVLGTLLGQEERELGTVLLRLVARVRFEVFQVLF